MFTLPSISRALSTLRMVLIVAALPILFLLVMQRTQAADAPPDDTAQGLVHAAEVEGAANNVVIRGILRRLPLSGGLLGDWLIQTKLHVTRTVVVLNLNVLQDQDILPGTWVRADATINLFGLTIATKLRIDDYEADQIVVRLANNAYLSAVASQYNLTHDSTMLASGSIHLYRTNNANQNVEQIVQQMASDAKIVWAELNYIGDTPEGDPYKTWGWGGTDPSGYVNQGAFDQVNLAPALEQYQGDGVIVAVLDTGIDRNHPALAGRWLNGVDVIADDTTPQDEGPQNDEMAGAWGHGTHVAGIITHVALDSMILPVRVLNVDGRGNTFTLAYAIEWAVQQGADVINLSLGTRYDSQVLRGAVESAMAQGVVFVAATGNQNTSALQYPAAYSGMIATTAVDGENHKADFANYGHWVLMAAPGVGITSTIVGPQGSGYASWNGTSMATPFVSGAAALARQRLPNGTTTEIIALLTDHADDLNSANPNYVDQLGGLLDIGAALTSGLQAAESSEPTMSASDAETGRFYLPLVVK